MLRTLLNDEAGFIVSAELVLVATLCVIGLIVGLSQVQHAVVEELTDVAHAIGALNQTYQFTGFSAEKSTGTKSQTMGASYKDDADTCDYRCSEVACDAAMAECTALRP